MPLTQKQSLVLGACVVGSTTLIGCGGGGDDGNGKKTPEPDAHGVTDAPTIVTTGVPTTTIYRSPCIAYEVSQGTWCRISANATKEQVGMARAYIFGEGNLDSRTCEGAPDDEVFNSYFQFHLEQGRTACDFGGVGTLVQPEGSPCNPRIQDSNWCQTIEGATPDAMGSALGYICANGVDCTPVSEGGQCVFPQDEDLVSKTNWAVNEWYQSHSVTQGDSACDFGGMATLVPSPCGQWNDPNPSTGKGFAFPDQTCLSSEGEKCGCIKDGSDWTACRRCVSKDPEGCEMMCPWIQTNMDQSTAVAI